MLCVGFFLKSASHLTHSCGVPYPALATTAFLGAALVAAAVAAVVDDPAAGVVSAGGRVTVGVVVAATLLGSDPAHEVSVAPPKNAAAADAPASCADTDAAAFVKND